MEKAKEKLKNCKDEQKEFYECTILVLEGAVHFMQRYHDLIEREKIESLKEVGKDLLRIFLKDLQKLFMKRCNLYGFYL